MSPAIIGEVLKIMRKSRKWSRGQVALRLKVTPTVIYNMETGRSRIPLSHFMSFITLFGKPAKELIGTYLFAVKSIEYDVPGEVVKIFRKRLRLSQKDMAGLLGYKSISMIHHFEKGLREPSIIDFLKMMNHAQDDVRGLILELTKNKELSEHFPEGQSSHAESWVDYWSHYYIPAIRQIMRTLPYLNSQEIRSGYFAKILDLSEKQERHALDVLSKVGAISWQKGKPIINAKIKIVMPKGVSIDVIDRLKKQWIEYGLKKFLERKEDNDVVSIDLLPISKKQFEEVVKRIRQLQDEIHNMTIEDADGFIHLGWIANMVPVPAAK